MESYHKTKLYKSSYHFLVKLETSIWIKPENTRANLDMNYEFRFELHWSVAYASELVLTVKITSSIAQDYTHQTDNISLDG